MPALRALLPPYDDSEDSRNELARALRGMFGCEAVSCFLVSRTVDGKMELQIFSHDGYRSKPRSYQLGTAKVFLTTHVFEEVRGTFNQSAQYLRDHPKIPFSNRCQSFLKSQRFDNILAIPVCTVEGRYVGILKFENKEGRDGSQEFPQEDVAMAEELAKLIGVFVGHRAYCSLWVAWAKEERKSLQTFVDILAKHAPAQCASVFVRKDGVLKNSGGVGYKEPYKIHEYKVPASVERPAHLTTWVAVNKIAVRKTIKELEEMKANGFPFSNACEEHIGTPLRNLLALPVDVELEGVAIAVVKLENRLPLDAHFDEQDERIYSEFSRHVVTSLLPQKRQRRSVLAGVQFVSDVLGPPPPTDLGKRDPDRLNELIQRANELHLKHPKIVTIEVVCAYFRFAKGTWYAHVPTVSHQVKVARQKTFAAKKKRKFATKKKRT